MRQQGQLISPWREGIKNLLCPFLKDELSVQLLGPPVKIKNTTFKQKAMVACRLHGLHKVHRTHIHV